MIDSIVKSKYYIENIMIKEHGNLITEPNSFGFIIYCVYFFFLWLYRNGIGKTINSLGPLFSLAFFFGVVVSILIFFKSIQQIHKYAYIENNSRIIESTPESTFQKCLNNVNVLIYQCSTLMIGFYLIGLTQRGSCRTDSLIYISDLNCKDYDLVDELPLDHIIYLLINWILGPLTLEQVGIISVIISFIISIIMIIISIIKSNDHLDPVIVIIIVMFILVYNQIRIINNANNNRIYPASNIQQESNSIKEAENLQKKLNNALVHQILPQKVADQIKEGKPVPPEEFENVTVFFSDVVGFTYICANVPPIMVVQMLNELYTVMDYCCSIFPLYKVETIGDAYMVVGGLIEKDMEHAQRVADFALTVQAAVAMVKSPYDGSPLKLRMGIHSGPVLAGVVGNLMPRYCLFGDTVNTASRMESNGEANRIHCSEVVANMLIESNQYTLTIRGDIEVKGKGKMTTYWLEGASLKNTNANKHALLKIRITVRDLLGLNRDNNSLSDIKTPTNSHISFFSSNYLRILVVEDSQLQRKVLMRMLKSADPSWDITFAITGESALEKLKATKLMFDVVIVDENLSSSKEDLFGHELVNIMRNSLQMKTCVIIACISNTNNKSHLLTSGVDEVWPKPPPDPILMYDTITELVNRKRKKSNLFTSGSSNGNYVNLFETSSTTSSPPPMKKKNSIY